MNEHEQKSFIRFLMKRLKEDWRELMVHRMVLQRLKMAGTDAEGLDALLDSARKSPELQEAYERQFSELDTLLPSEIETYDPETQKRIERIMELTKGKLPN